MAKSKLWLIVFLLLVFAAAFTAVKLLSSPPPAPSTSVKPTTPPLLDPIASPAPALSDWQTYQDQEFGYSFSYPSESQVNQIPPSTPKYCSLDYPECITEEQLSVLSISYQGPQQHPGPTSLTDGYSLTIKIVKKSIDQTVSQMADLFVKRCEQLLSPLTPQTIANLSGFQYTCEGIGPNPVFWGPFKNDPQKILGLSWFTAGEKAEEYQATIDQILSTLSF